MAEHIRRLAAPLGVISGQHDDNIRARHDIDELTAVSTGEIVRQQIG